MAIILVVPALLYRIRDDRSCVNCENMDGNLDSAGNCGLTHSASGDEKREADPYYAMAEPIEGTAICCSPSDIPVCSSHCEISSAVTHSSGHACAVLTDPDFIQSYLVSKFIPRITAKLIKPPNHLTVVESLFSSGQLAA